MYHITPLLEVGAAVRESPASSSVEKFALPAGMATLAHVAPSVQLRDGDEWRFVVVGSQSGWLRCSDVRMIPVTVTASDLADTIYGGVDDHLIENMLK